MSYITGFFRVVAKNAKPELRSTQRGSVLNINCAPISYGEGPTKWTTLELWGKLAEDLVAHVNHNDVFFVSGEEKVREYNEKLQFSVRVTEIKRVDLLPLYPKTVDTNAVAAAEEAILDAPF